MMTSSTQQHIASLVAGSKPVVDGFHSKIDVDGDNNVLLPLGNLKNQIE